jgi:hypothetical protein
LPPAEAGNAHHQEVERHRSRDIGAAVAADIGARNAASEHIAPMATHVINAPAATMIQRPEWGSVDIIDWFRLIAYCNQMDGALY